ncbi:MAG TPA: RluA family pseudouridine synthase [Candidatus Paceibacterota bacterium]
MKHDYKKFNIEILYKDADMMILNKPSGLITHPDGRVDEPSLSEWLSINYPKTKDVGEPINYLDGRVISKPGIVHRLDRETSGAIAVALNQKAFLHLKAQFQNREVRKLYHTFVFGELKEAEGKIERPIGRSARDQRLWSAMRGAKGTLRDALTMYRVMWKGQGMSFVETEPKTGRTHQIRVHFKAINYPVICDKLYAPKHGCAAHFDRTALHARFISIKNLKGEQIEKTAPYPKDFKKAIKELKIKL